MELIALATGFSGPTLLAANALGQRPVSGNPLRYVGYWFSTSGRAQYRANQADQQALEAALRPKPCLLATHSKLQEIVASKLMQDWSPRQISGWLKTQYPGAETRFSPIPSR